jgi:hypothetical protein
MWLLLTVTALVFVYLCCQLAPGWHMFGYYSSIAASAVNAPITAINDTIMTNVADGNLTSPQPGNIIFVCGLGANLVRLRLNTPKYRTISLPSLVPINGTLTVPSPVNIFNAMDYPLPVNAVDEIEIDATNSSGSADNEAAICGIKFGDVPWTPGTPIRVRATATVTCSTGTWVNGTMTLDQTLPAGVYAVIGMLAVGTNLAAARLVFPASVWRPGCVAMNADKNIPHPLFDRHLLGCWGLFESINLPSVDFLSVGSCTSQEVYLDLVYQSSTQLLGVGH